MNFAALVPWATRSLSILRIIAGLLFLQHGLQKHMGFPAPAPAHISTLLYVQGAIEIIGGILLTIGLLHATRPSSWLLPTCPAVESAKPISPLSVSRTKR
jgi:putative oxidoreductase